MGVFSEIDIAIKEASEMNYDRNNMTDEEFNERFNIDLGASLLAHELNQLQKEVTLNDIYKMLSIDTACGKDEVFDGYAWDQDHKEIIKG